MHKLLFSFSLLASIATAQATIRPPQPDYSKYGSYDRQVTVYTNAQRQLNELKLERYRKFREEVRRRTVTPEYVVVTTRTSSTCGVDAWRSRRCQATYRCGRSR